MIIKLFDNEQYSEYPLIEIKDNYFKEFEDILDNYRNNNPDTYDLDEFLKILEDFEGFIRTLYYNEEVFF